MTTKLPVRERKVANVVEIVRGNLRVDVSGPQKVKTLLPSLKFPLRHVLGAEVDPHIERRFWKAWVVVGANRVPEEGVRIYNPRLGNSDKAIVIWLTGESHERLVGEEPEAVAAKINEAVEASSPR